MKQSRIILAALPLLLLMAGCSKDGSRTQQPQDTATDTGFLACLADTRTTVDFASGEGIVKWIADDPVFITNGTQTATYYIKKGGSTSSVMYCKGTALDGDSFLSVYPSTGASYEEGVLHASIPTVQTYVKDGFASQTFPMVAVCGEDRVLNYRNAASLLKIVPTGWSGAKVSQITINAQVPIAGDLTVAYDGTTAPTVTCNGSKSVTVMCGGIEIGEPIYAVVAPGTYENLSVVVSIVGGLSVKCTSQQAVEVERSRFAVSEYDISSQFKDLSNEGTANCYIISEPGSYRFKASVRGNGVTTSCGLSAKNEDASSAVQYYADGETFVNGGFSYIDGYIYFSTVEAESIPIGTSLINLKNSSGQVIWSWHLWANPNVKDITLGNYTWMNMNLGAHSTTWNDEGYMGYYYQWGRKDPMMQKAGLVADFKNPWASHASLTDGSIENSILNPSFFYGSYYLNSNTSTPMISDWASYTDDMSQVVWDWWCVGLTGATTTGKTVKTMWDPCPPGYKVPEADAFNALISSKWTWDEFDVDNHSHKSGDFLVPTISHRSAGVAGFGSATGNWKGGTANTPAYAWSSFPGTAASKGKIYGNRGWFRNKSCGISETPRAYASPVRCIKDIKDE